MADRLRALLDRPLDPSAARAILVFASAILVGFAGLFILAASQPDRPTSPDRPSPAASPPDPIAPAGATKEPQAERPTPSRRQDPQDIDGSAASRRAARALRSHRALQHVPYRDSQLAVALIGARGGRAVLRVSAFTVREARRGWRRFLQRYSDSGRAYVVAFARRGRDDG
jgi:hypothetical protein